MDYIHFNPVKHGFVAGPADWQFSSFFLYASRPGSIRRNGERQ
jgi:hypothetical protein